VKKQSIIEAGSAWTKAHLTNIYRYSTIALSLLVGLAALADLLYPEIPPYGVLFKDLQARPIEILYLEQGSCPRPAPGDCKLFSTSKLQPREQKKWLDKINSIRAKPPDEEQEIIKAVGSSNILATGEWSDTRIKEREQYDVLREHPGKRPALYILFKPSYRLSGDDMARLNAPHTRPEDSAAYRPWYDVAASIIRFAIILAILAASVSMVWYAPHARTFVLAMGLVLFAITAYPLDFVWTTYVPFFSPDQQIGFAEWLMRLVHPPLLYLSSFLIGLFILIYSGKSSRFTTALWIVGLLVTVALSAANVFIYVEDLHTPRYHALFQPFVAFAIAWTLAWLIACYFASLALTRDPRTNEVRGLNWAFIFVLIGIVAESVYYGWYINAGYERGNSLGMAALSLCYLVLPIGTCAVLSKRGLIRVVSPGLLVLGGSTAIAVLAKLVDSNVTKSFENKAGFATLIASFLVLVALPQVQTWITDRFRAFLKDPTCSSELEGLQNRLESAPNLRSFGDRALDYIKTFSGGDSSLMLYLDGAAEAQPVAGANFVRHENVVDFFHQLGQAAESAGTEVDLPDGRRAIAVPLRDNSRVFGFIVYVPVSTAWAPDPCEALPACVVVTIAIAALKRAYLDSAQTLKDLVLDISRATQFSGFARISSVRIAFREER